MSKDKDLLNRFVQPGRVDGRRSREPVTSDFRTDWPEPARWLHPAPLGCGDCHRTDCPGPAPAPGRIRRGCDRPAGREPENARAAATHLRPVERKHGPLPDRDRRAARRAAALAGRPTITAVIIEGERTESQILEMQLIENCLREDLKPVEQAKAFRTLMEQTAGRRLRRAEVLHLNCATVTRALALLGLPEPSRSRSRPAALAPSVAYEISKVEDQDCASRAGRPRRGRGPEPDKRPSRRSAAPASRPGKAKNKGATGKEK